MGARRLLILSAVLLPAAVATIDNSILNVALPTLVRDLHASTAQLQWIVDSYVLIFAGGMLTAATLGDRIGRKRVLDIGLVVFGLASMGAAWTQTPAQLVILRGAMGVGASLMLPMTLSLIPHVFEDPTDRSSAVAAWAAIAGVGLAAGPLLGGVLLAHFWWGSVFLVNVPLVVYVLAVGRWVIPESRAESPLRGDLVGTVTSLLGMSAMLYAVIEAPDRGWTSLATVLVFVAGLALLWLFVWWERRIEHPVLDLILFLHPRFSRPLLCVSASNFAIAGAVFLAAQYFQFARGFTTFQTGMAMTPLAVCMVVGSSVSPRVVARAGIRATVAAALGLEAVGLAGAATASSVGSPAGVITALGATGLGMSMILGPAIGAMLAAIPPHRSGMGSGAQNLVRQAMAALGVAIAGSLLSSTYGNHLRSSVSGLGLSRNALDNASNSAGTALATADRLSGPTGHVLAAAARSSFVDGYALATCAAVVVCVLGAVFAALKVRPDAAGAAGATGSVITGVEDVLPLEVASGELG